MVLVPTGCWRSSFQDLVGQKMREVHCATGEHFWVQNEGCGGCPERPLLGAQMKTAQVQRGLVKRSRNLQMSTGSVTRTH